MTDRVSLLLIKLSSPAMAGMIIYSLFSLVDTFFVTRLGSAAMAALTLCLPVYLLVTSLASATGVGLTSVISRALGEGNIEYADNVAWHGLVISIIYSLVFMWVGITNIDFLLLLFGCPPEIFALSRQYLIINLLACMFTFPPMIISNIIQGEGNTVIPMVTLLVGMAINIILDPILMFGAGPLKGLGLNGAALASVLAEIFLTVIFIVILLRRKAYLPWLWRNFRPSLKALTDIFAVAIPSTVMEVVGVGVMVFLNRAVVGYGSTPLAALGIFLRIRSLFYMPVFGLAQGALPIIGFAYGAGNNDRVKEAIIKSLVISFLLMSLSWLLIQWYPFRIMSFFSNDPTLTRIGIQCLQWAALFLPVMGPVIIFYTVLQALGKGMTAMVLSLLRQVGLFLPLLVILPSHLGLNGVWLSFALSELLSAFLTAAFLIHLWRELQTRRKLALLMLLNPGFLRRRVLAWLKW